MNKQFTYNPVVLVEMAQEYLEAVASFWAPPMTGLATGSRTRRAPGPARLSAPLAGSSAPM